MSGRSNVPTACRRAGRARPARCRPARRSSGQPRPGAAHVQAGRHDAPGAIRQPVAQRADVQVRTSQVVARAVAAGQGQWLSPQRRSSWPLSTCCGRQRQAAVAVHALCPRSVPVERVQLQRALRALARPCGPGWTGFASSAPFQPASSRPGSKALGRGRCTASQPRRRSAGCPGRPGGPWAAATVSERDVQLRPACPAAGLAGSQLARRAGLGIQRGAVVLERAVHVAACRAWPARGRPRSAGSVTSFQSRCSCAVGVARTGRCGRWHPACPDAAASAAAGARAAAACRPSARRASSAASCTRVVVQVERAAMRALCASPWASSAGGQLPDPGRAPEPGRGGAARHVDMRLPGRRAARVDSVSSACARWKGGSGRCWRWRGDRCCGPELAGPAATAGRPVEPDLRVGRDSRWRSARRAVQVDAPSGARRRSGAQRHAVAGPGAGQVEPSATNRLSAPPVHAHAVDLGAVQHQVDRRAQVERFGGWPVPWLAQARQGHVQRSHAQRLQVHAPAQQGEGRQVRFDRFTSTSRPLAPSR